LPKLPDNLSGSLFIYRHNVIEIMANPLLKTKIAIPPMRAEIVRRNRLMDRVAAELKVANGFNRQLTLVSAPA